MCLGNVPRKYGSHSANIMLTLVSALMLLHSACQRVSRSVIFQYIPDIQGGSLYPFTFWHSADQIALNLSLVIKHMPWDRQYIFPTTHMIWDSAHLVSNSAVGAELLFRHFFQPKFRCQICWKILQKYYANEKSTLAYAVLVPHWQNQVPWVHSLYYKRFQTSYLHTVSSQYRTTVVPA